MDEEIKNLRVIVFQIREAVLNAVQKSEVQIIFCSQRVMWLV